MKIRLAFISYLIILSLSSCLRHEKEDNGIIKKGGSELTVIPIHKGNYFKGSNRSYGTFYSYDIKVINNTTSRFEFWTLSAAPEINVVIDPDKLDFFIPSFSRNVPQIITLEPNQEFVVPIILSKNDSVRIDSIRFGFIIYKPEYKVGFPKSLDFEKNPKDKLNEMRMINENVIWSHKLRLFESNEFRYEIRTILNDSTFYVISKQRLYQY